MDILRINGGSPLKGTITVSGAKNACLPIFAACLLTEEPCIIENAPNLSDVRFMVQIIQHLGAEVAEVAPNTWKIHAKNLSGHTPYDLVRKMRASVCLMGPIIGRLGETEISLPGGCVIGHRPIDIHLRGLEKLGCVSEIKNGYIRLSTPNGLHGANIFLGGRQGSTVTGTANILMAAVLTPGITRIDSAACEPEVEDLCNMLVQMGAKIDGIGSPTLIIEGVKKLSGAKYRVIGDRIEAGTFILAGLQNDSDIVVQGADPNHLRSFLHHLDDADIKIDSDNNIYVKGLSGTLSAKDIVTHPFPGYPTDIQAQMMALLTTNAGISVITERIYPQRFMHVPELLRMGADISLEGGTAIIKGVEQLSGAAVMASDLRASAALVLAGLKAKGETWIQRVYHIDRGYENIEEKLAALGASIQRLPSSELPVELAS